MYHRVSAPAVDPWGLSVHPNRFREHVEVLRDSRTPLALPDFVARLQAGTLPDNAVAITFDDGYRDNLREARPCLADAHVPATVFLAAGAIGQTREFWWDEVARGLLGRRQALDCEIALDGSACRLSFAAAGDDELRENSWWRAWQEPRTGRQRTYLDFWQLVRDVSAAERDAAMDQFRSATNLGAADLSDLPMTAGEVAELTRDGLVQIGGHTVSHPVLTLLGPEERQREILEGKRRCEELANGPVSGFAYPHGAENEACRNAVRENGFAWACTTINEPVQRSGDVYALPRLFVQDWNAAAFKAALT
jgi:peptidoglycan/xylan/chitin deacetylase (PgdA/CDA1 family)